MLARALVADEGEPRAVGRGLGIDLINTARLREVHGRGTIGIDQVKFPVAVAIGFEDHLVRISPQLGAQVLGRLGLIRPGQHREQGKQRDRRKPVAIPPFHARYSSSSWLNRDQASRMRREIPASVPPPVDPSIHQNSRTQAGQMPGTLEVIAFLLWGPAEGALSHHHPVEAGYDAGHETGQGTRGCCTVVRSGATRSRIGLGVTSHEAM